MATREVVAEPLLMTGHERQEAMARAERLLARLNIPERLWDLSPTTFSGGEQQRVNIARGFAYAYPAMLLDEPTANVDVHGQVEFYELIRRIRDDRKCGILLVSHDLHLVMSATDRVVCLNGHVCCSGLPGDVSTDPAYLELFGDAASTVAVYSHDHDHHHA